MTLGRSQLRASFLHVGPPQSNPDYINHAFSLCTGFADQAAEAWWVVGREGSCFPWPAGGGAMSAAGTVRQAFADTVIYER